MSNEKDNTARSRLTLGTTPKCIQRPAEDLLPQSGVIKIEQNQPKVLIPKPCAGLVIFYDYTWHKDFARKDESDKPRPCVIMAVKPNPDHPKNPNVIVAPITHTAPDKALRDLSIRIPKNIGKSIGLDNQRSFIRCHEVNMFEWPGPDLTPIPGRGNNGNKRVDYGLMDKDLFDQTKQLFAQIGRQLVVRRDPACDLAEHGL